MCQPCQCRCITAQRFCLKATVPQHHCLAAWHACSHACHFPELIHSGPRRAVCKSAEFPHYHLAAWHTRMYCAVSQCHHVVQQACSTHSCHVPVVSCGSMGSPIVTCHAPASCRRNVGVTVCTPTMPQHWYLGTCSHACCVPELPWGCLKHLITSLPSPLVATWRHSHTRFHTFPV